MTEFVVIPGWHNQQLIFGYVRYQGTITWVTTAAPYLFDLLTYALIFPIGMRVVFQRHWVWLNVIILGLISPVVNSLYQYLKPVLGLRGDVAGLLEMLPAYAVHAYFLLTLLGYTYGLILVFRRSRHLAAGNHKINENTPSGLSFL